MTRRRHETREHRLAVLPEPRRTVRFHADQRNEAQPIVLAYISHDVAFGAVGRRLAALRDGLGPDVGRARALRPDSGASEELSRVSKRGRDGPLPERAMEDLSFYASQPGCASRKVHPSPDSTIRTRRTGAKGGRQDERLGRPSTADGVE